MVDRNYAVSPAHERLQKVSAIRWEHVKAEFERKRAAEKGDPRTLRMQARGVITHMVVGDRLLKRWRRRTNGAPPAVPASACAASAQYMV